MIRHPHYLDLPWDVHWQGAAPGAQRHLWWLIAVIVILAMFMVGVGNLGGNV